MTLAVRRAWPGGLSWALWALSLIGLATTAWLDQLLRQAGRSELVSLGAGNVPLAVAAAIAATVGALVASRRPRHPVGWLLLAMGLSMTLSGALSSYRWYGLEARPGALPAAGYTAGLANGLNIVYLSCAGFVLLLTPTGTLPSRRWRWWARVAAAAAGVFLLGSVVDPVPYGPDSPSVGNPLGVPAMAGLLDALIPASGALVLVALVVGAGSLIGRFRRARGTERQQLRWLAWGAALAAVALLLAIAELGSMATPACSRRRSAPALPCCCWRPARRSCATGCTTWTASSAAPSPTGCSP